MNAQPPDLHVIVFACEAGVPGARLFTVPCVTLMVAATVATVQAEGPERIALLYDGNVLLAWYRDGARQFGPLPVTRFAERLLGVTQFTIPLPLGDLAPRSKTEQPRTPEHGQSVELFQLKAA